MIDLRLVSIKEHDEKIDVGKQYTKYRVQKVGVKKALNLT